MFSLGPLATIQPRIHLPRDIPRNRVLALALLQAYCFALSLKVLLLAAGRTDGPRAHRTASSSFVQRSRYRQMCLRRCVARARMFWAANDLLPVARRFCTQKRGGAGGAAVGSGPGRRLFIRRREDVRPIYYHVSLIDTWIDSTDPPNPSLTNAARRPLSSCSDEGSGRSHDDPLSGQ